jgi:23S rRNA (uracil-5-)-methyltransferase RumA
MRTERLDLQVAAVHHLDAPWRYRSTAGIALGKRAGFRRHGSLAIVPIRDCPISHPLIGQLMAYLNDAIERGALPDFHGRVRVEVRVMEGGERDSLVSLVRPTEVSHPPHQGDLDMLLAALTNFPEMVAVSTLLEGDRPTSVAGEAFGVTTVVGRPVTLAAGSFFQTNLQLLPRLIQRLRQEAEPLSGRRVADVYAGVGLFGLFLADEATEVTIVESDPIAIEAAKRTAERWKVSNVRFISSQAEQALEELGHVDVLIADPPRAGLSESVRASIARFQPPTVLYVSCLAQSLARDLHELTAVGYGVESLELFDFYPQTYHVELLAVLRGSSI